MPSTEYPRLSAGARRRLIDLAWGSLRHGLAHGTPIPVVPQDCPAALRRPGAAFVTLHAHGALRGCIGHLEAHQPLAVDVAENAYAAGFRDPRFPRLRARELDELALDISVLTPPEPLDVCDEADLLRRLRPGVDGLILEDPVGFPGARGTFLPAVWESLPEPGQFLAQLRRKAGLPADYWSPTLKVMRYRTETFDA